MVSLGGALAKTDTNSITLIFQTHNGFMWRGLQSQTYLAYGDAW